MTGSAAGPVEAHLVQGSLTYDYHHRGQLIWPQGREASVLEVPTGNRVEREVVGYVHAIETGSAPRTGSRDGLIGLAVVDRVYADVARQPAGRVRGSRPEGLV
jgi:hypothetical protein